eukprot:scaffold9071_cov108-Skeletonema_dohrnii-CCMP3373.AAC.9
MNLSRNKNKKPKKRSCIYMDVVNDQQQKRRGLHAQKLLLLCDLYVTEEVDQQRMDSHSNADANATSARSQVVLHCTN